MILRRTEMIDFSPLVSAFYILAGIALIAVPLALWKIVDVAMFLTAHIHVFIN